MNNKTTNFDYKSLLGKRLRFTFFLSDELIITTGRCLGYHVTHPDFKHFSNQILFLEDDFDEPDWICFEDFESIEILD